MTSLRAVQSAYTRRLILDVTRRIISKHGSANTRIKHISDAIGTSRATFYRHFTSKDAVVKELLSPALRETQAHYELFANISEWTPRSIGIWLSHLLHIWGRHHRELRSVFVDDINIVRSEFSDRLESFVEAILGSRVLISLLDGDEARRRVRLMLLQHLSAIVESAGNIDATDDALLDTLAQMWIGALSSSRTCRRSEQQFEKVS